MDPDAAVIHIIDALDEGDWADAREYAGYLVDWLRRGGFWPSAAVRRDLAAAVTRAEPPKGLATKLRMIAKGR